MEITLTAFEQKIAKHITAGRQRHAKSVNAKNLKLSDESDETVSLDGTGAEIAFCRYFNVYPDFAVGEYAYADAFTVQMGSVDIKTTRIPHGHLIAHYGKRLKRQPDSYALMLGAFPTYRFAGYADSSELICDESIKDFGKGPTFALRQDQLRPVEQRTLF